MIAFKRLHFATKVNTKVQWVSACIQFSSLKGRKSRYERFLHKVDREKDPGHSWNEDDEDIISEIESSHNLQEALRLEEKKQQTRKFKMIERKYFKPTQEANLLTWDAKEQIRYLHKEYPSEWTIEKLAESFPISIDGIKRILRSQYVPKSLQEVISHDKKARNNWLFLKDGSAKSGPVAIRFEKLLVDGKIKNLQYATGNKALPHPKVIIGNRHKQLESGCRTDGLFASIVKGYVEKKTESSIIQKVPEQHDQLEKENKSNLKLLSEISGKSHSKPYKTSLKDGNIPRAINNTAMFKYRDLNIKLDKNFEKSNFAEAEKEHSSYATYARRKNKVTNMLEKSTQFSYENDYQVTADNSQQILIKETLNRPLAQKRGSWQSKENKDKDMDVSFDHKHNDITDPYVKQKQKLYKNISYDYPSRNGKIYKEKDAYLYDAKSGYQYPFGKVDRSLESIDVPQNKEGDLDGNRLYKRDNNYYDEDGEFLFRVP